MPGIPSIGSREWFGPTPGLPLLIERDGVDTFNVPRNFGEDGKRRKGPGSNISGDVQRKNKRSWPLFQAGLADDLRKEVFRLLNEGASDQGIIDFLVKRYGEFVLYKPRIKPATYALWYGPAALLLLAALALFILIRRRAKTAVIAPCGPQAEQVRRLLDQD